MAESSSTPLPAPNAEQRRVAAGQFERASQVLASRNHDYAIQLLLTCCKLDPANLIYRQTLRRTEKKKFNNNRRGSKLAFLTTSAARAKLKAAKAARDHLKTLEHGEEILAKNPWDVGAQMDMAEAADALGLIDLAVWSLENARQDHAKDMTLNRALARMYEKRGNFSHAIALWGLVHKAEPADAEAQRKAKDLAASETIARGKYGASLQTQPAADDTAEAVGAASIAPNESTPLALPSSATEERFNREVQNLRKRIDSDPTNPIGYLQLAAHFRRADRPDDANKLLESGLGPTGNNFEIASELSDLAIEPFRKNLILTEERIRHQPEDEDLRKIRLQLLREINSRELDLYRHKSSRFPNEMVHRVELGIRLLRAGHTDEAIVELQAARSDPRQRARALTYLGYCFKARHNWRLAERNFEEALQQLLPAETAQRKEILYQLAQGSAEAGDLSKAVDLACELANLDFAYRDIGRLLEVWQEKLQQA